MQILDSPSWKIYWKWWHKSVDWKSTQQRLVCLGRWQWCNKNVVYVLPVVWEVFSEVQQKYDVGLCVVRWHFWDYHAKAQLYNFWTWNFLCKLGAQNIYVSKINWKLQKFFLKFVSCMYALNISTALLDTLIISYVPHNTTYFIISPFLVHKI
jgi:hypothetical protein